MQHTLDDPQRTRAIVKRWLACCAKKDKPEWFRQEEHGLLILEPLYHAVQAAHYVAEQHEDCDCDLCAEVKGMPYSLDIFYDLLHSITPLEPLLRHEHLFLDDDEDVEDVPDKPALVEAPEHAA